ncbi:MAG: 50S ribosomal protein L6 [Christensenellaceae bacterium]|nr:50S ribosomal protein L6 [Christensenellaceae bacterium]
MSRIGRLPVAVPAGVTVKVEAGNLVSVKGAKGELVKQFPAFLTIEQKENEILVSRHSEAKNVKAAHGMTRAILNNMVNGVNTPFTKVLEIVGVGYQAKVAGKVLSLTIGKTHPVDVKVPDDVTVSLESPTAIVVTGCDKQRVGQFADFVKKLKTPDAYHGVGIRYRGEEIKLKVGKSGM